MLPRSLIHCLGLDMTESAFPRRSARLGHNASYERSIKQVAGVSYTVSQDYADETKLHRQRLCVLSSGLGARGFKRHGEGGNTDRNDSKRVRAGEYEQVVEVFADNEDLLSPRESSMAQAMPQSSTPISQHSPGD